jgi:hypothetical protein
MVFKPSCGSEYSPSFCSILGQRARNIAHVITPCIGSSFRAIQQGNSDTSMKKVDKRGDRETSQRGQKANSRTYNFVEGVRA